MMPLTRAFLALELDDPTRAHIQTHVEALKAVLPGVRFVASTTWHLTLAFLGEIDTATVTTATEAAQAAAAQVAPFTLRTAEIGIFGSMSAPKVIWIGVADNRSALLRLHHVVAQALRHRQIAFDQRFSPHITLARLRQPLVGMEAEELGRMLGTRKEGPSLPVSQISLMRSERLPSGAVYTALARVALATNP